jgi:CubicO group peptidase (beta-lactamase class C family)
VVLIALRGETVLAEGYGLADRERGSRWTPETVSTVGSITKQFTAAAILLLEEEGRLRVRDRIAEYFAGVPADKRDITLHHLLTHGSGIVDLEGADDWDPIGREEFVQRALVQDLAFPPGEGHEYSNAGYSLLGAIIEQITGASYETFVRERLFLPAGMKDTGYILAAWAPERVAQGYDGGEAWGTVLGRPIAGDGPYWVLRANGGIHSTARDMLLWAEALRGGRILRRESLEKLWTPHVDEGVGSAYGYGWSIQEHGGVRVITHNGGNGIFFADFAIVPEHELVVFLQTNTVRGFPGAGRVLEYIDSRLLAGVTYPRVPDRAPAPPMAMAGAAGEYRLPEGGAFRVRPDSGELVLEAEGRGAFSLLHSTRGPDPARSARLSQRIDDITRALMTGDFAPLAAAYEGRVTEERLRERWEEVLRASALERGAILGYEVLGTALTEERDVTLVRYQFERGHMDRAYVWDPGAEEHLLGVSARGMDPWLRFVPEESGGYASWDGGLRPSVPLRFSEGSDGKLHLMLADRFEGVRDVAK